MGYYAEKITDGRHSAVSKIFSDVNEANALLEIWLGNDRRGLEETYPSESDDETDLRFIHGGGNGPDYFLCAETAEDKQRAIAEGFPILIGSAYKDAKQLYNSQKKRDLTDEKDQS